MTTPAPIAHDPELLAMEERIAELARTRAHHLREADALTKGLKGLLASWRGDRDQRIDDCIQTARMCKMEIDRLREEHDRRLAELDPVKAEEVARLEERKLLLEQATQVRKMGGPQVDVLNRLEAERRPHIEFIDELEHVLRVGEHARLATEEYQRRLRAEVAQLEAGSLTARIGKLATVKTAGAEARESLLAFVRKVGIGDESMVRIFQSTEVDAELEAQNCARNLKDLAAMMATYEADLDAARRELRPIEMAYRNFLATTTGSSPPRVNMPRKTPTGL